jgi:hypothetical protein
MIITMMLMCHSLFKNFVKLKKNFNLKRRGKMASRHDRSKVSFRPIVPPSQKEKAIIDHKRKDGREKQEFRHICEQ